MITPLRRDATWLIRLLLVLFAVQVALPLSAGTPYLGTDSNGYKVFQVDDQKFVLWGVDADTWGCQAGDTALFHQHCDALNYVNANCIAIPTTWRMIEPTAGTYSYTALDSYLDLAYQHGLKAIVLWIGIDYAGGDAEFVPAYILNTPTTYSRIAGLDNTNLLCPSDLDTASREALAYGKVLEHLAVKNPQISNTVLAIAVNGETDYLKALNTAYWSPGSEDHTRRCTCANCNALYVAGQDKVQFMAQRFATYQNQLIGWNAGKYDIPNYHALAPWRWWPDWRYAEDPTILKATMTRADFFVAPSVAETSSASVFVEEMNRFLPSAIAGNQIFVDGIDTGWDGNNGLPNNQPHIECAPWYTTLWYAGLGAIYWDNPGLSIRSDATLRTKLRKSWGPLYGMQYWIARYKSQGTNVKFWWEYGATHTWGSMSSFAIDQVSTAQDYGVAFQLGPTDITFTGSTYGGAYTFKVCQANIKTSGYKFERGYFDKSNGAWVKFGNVTPTFPDNNNAQLTVSDDSGDYTKVAYRFYK